MVTISFDKPIKATKKHFKSLEEFQLHVVEEQQKSELDDFHKEILDDRLEDLKQNPSHFSTIQDFKTSLNKF